MAAYLLKTEPDTYSFADLQRDKRTTWDGVSNAAALINLRAIKKGDDIFIYHTGDEKAIVGLAKAASNAFEDPKQPGATADGKPKFAVVDLVPGKPAKTSVTLATIKADKRFADFALVKISRLSVMPVPPAMEKALREMAGL
jgi:predicted RNA-binding protein with PUA-like domain